MRARIHSHGWRCDMPGCRGCGAGYPSERAASVAERRHMERNHRGTEAGGLR